MAIDVEPINVRGSLGKGTGFGFIIITAPSTGTLVISARYIIIALDTIQAASIVGSSNIATLWLWWI